MAKKLAGRRSAVRNQAILHAKSISAADPAHNSDRPISWPQGQFFTGLSRRSPVTCARFTLFLTLALAGCRAAPSTAERSATNSGTVSRGGELLVSSRSELASFNRHA